MASSTNIQPCSHPPFHHSTVPLFHRFTIPPFHHSTAPTTSTPAKLKSRMAKAAERKRKKKKKSHIPVQSRKRHECPSQEPRRYPVARREGPPLQDGLDRRPQLSGPRGRGRGNRPQRVMGVSRPRCYLAAEPDAVFAAPEPGPKPIGPNDLTRATSSRLRHRPQPCLDLRAPGLPKPKSLDG
jgi:hypothetical protein